MNLTIDFNRFYEHPGLPLPRPAAPKAKPEPVVGPHLPTPIVGPSGPPRGEPLALDSMAENIHELRAASFRDLNVRFWSRGLPALASPIRPRRERVVDHNGREVDLDKVRVPARAPDAKHLSPAEWTELRALVATAGVEPSISREVHDEMRGTFAEAKCLSLDWLAEDGGDLHEVVHDEPYGPYGDEASTDRMAERYGTPVAGGAGAAYYTIANPEDDPTEYIVLDTTVRDRIEWEQQVAQDGTVARARFVHTPRGVEVFVNPRHLDPERKKRITESAVASWLASHKLTSFPDPETFRSLQAADAAAAKSTTRNARIASMAREIRDALDGLAAERDDFDALLNTSLILDREVLNDEDWSAELLPDQHFVAHRSPRRSRDELWHEDLQLPDEQLSTLGLGIAEADSIADELMGLVPCDACEDGLVDPEALIPTCTNGHSPMASVRELDRVPMDIEDGVLVQLTGDREWTDRAMVRAALLERRPDIVICGCARGLDFIGGHDVAVELGIHVIHMPAEWDRHGRRAGPLRNVAMAKRALLFQLNGYRVEVLAFHDNLDASKGTRHMVETCLRAGLEVTYFTH